VAEMGIVGTSAWELMLPTVANLEVFLHIMQWFHVTAAFYIFTSLH